MTQLMKTFNEKSSIPAVYDILFKDFFNTDLGFNFLANTHIKSPVDIYTTEEGIFFEIATVGVNLEDLKITTENGTLRVRYTKEASLDQEDRKYLVKNIARRSFDHGWKVPQKYSIDGIKATLSKGLLTIHLPVAEQAKPVDVEISLLD